VEDHPLGTNTGLAKANDAASDLGPKCEWVALPCPDAFAAPAGIGAFRIGMAYDARATKSAIVMWRSPAYVGRRGRTMGPGLRLRIAGIMSLAIGWACSYVAGAASIQPRIR
jgi:hypothetical protein